ncbi:hypothetical protein D3C85_1690080 [compost metagenome]
MIVIAEDVHEVEIHRTVGRPARDKNQWLPCTRFPVRQIYTVTGSEAADFKVGKVRSAECLVNDFVGKVKVFAEHGRERLID